MQVEVRGAAAKIDAIFRFDKTAWRGIQKGVKEAAEAITKDARDRVPPMGLVPKRAGTGWGKWIASADGRDLSYSQSDFKFKTRFRSKLRKGFREIQGQAQLDTSNPAVAIFALAGSKDASGHPFNANINKQTDTRANARDVGMWPRMLTPAYHAKAPEASKTIGRIIEDAVNEINRA